MKAFTFIEYVYGPLTTGREYLAGVKIDLSVFNFLSQPFKPDMIVRYFVGWECINTGRYDGGKYRILFETIYNRKYHLLKHGAAVNGSPCPYPGTTLNDFIRDAQRAGIELIFNELAIKEMGL